MRLGEVIQNYLIEHDMSLRAFARLSGVTATNLSYIINGKTPRGNIQAPTIKTYQKIARAMGITTDELVGMVDDQIAWGNKIILTEEEKELIRLWRGASDVGRAKAIGNLEATQEDTDSAVG